MKENTELDLEKEDPAAAIKQYERLLKKEKLNSRVYTRLMIVYRRQKEYRKEQALIKTAIAAFEDFYEKHQPSHSKKVRTLSKALSLSTGLTNKSGRTLNDPEPIASWRKRLTTLAKKLK